MTHADIRNPALYADRTVQEWHRDAFPNDYTAIDVDLLGACRRCRNTLYLIEATTNTENKTYTIVQRLAQRSGAHAFVVFHDERVVTGAKKVWPLPLLALQTDQLVALVHLIRDAHICPDVIERQRTARATDPTHSPGNLQLLHPA